ncbi:MAG: HEAT repeat domain-containing protein [Proteobacteria bacterium]|nr:HEAT repeat domain-containing protein [Pseudomonadota bacterium]
MLIRAIPLFLVFGLCFITVRKLVLFAVVFVLSFCLPTTCLSQEKDRVYSLIQNLKSNSATIYGRSQAAKALGEIRDIRGVEPLIVALKDETYVVREAAAWALGGIKDIRAVEPLIAALNSVKRQPVAWALGEIKDIRAVEPLIAALKDEAREHGVYTHDIGDALVTIGRPAVEPLITALGDERSGVRVVAASALGEIKDIRAVKPLITAALNDNSSDVRLYATKALEKMKDARVEILQPLLVALKNPNSVTRIGAAKTLGEIGDTDAIDSLMASLGDGDANVRKEVAQSLIMIGAKSDETFVVSMADNTGSWETWVRMAWQKGAVKDARIVKELNKSLKIRDAAVVAGAYPFFIRNGERGSESILVEALEKFGNEVMAFDFLNCGNAELRNASEIWAVKKGYKIKQWQGSGGTGPIWGSSR